MLKDSKMLVSKQQTNKKKLKIILKKKKVINKIPSGWA